VIVGENKARILRSPDFASEPTEEYLVPGTEFGVREELVNGERKFLCLEDGRGFVSDHSRKDAERVVAKRLAQDASFFVGQDVIAVWHWLCLLAICQ